MNTIEIADNPTSGEGCTTGEVSVMMPATVTAIKRAPVCDPGLEGLDITCSTSIPDVQADAPAEDAELMKWGFVPLYRISPPHARSGGLADPPVADSAAP